MKHIISFSMFLVFLLTSCKLPTEVAEKQSEEKGVYFIEHFPSISRLMQLKEDGKIIDVTPKDTMSILNGSLSPSGNYIAFSAANNIVFVDVFSDPSDFNPPDIGMYILDTRTMELNRIADFGYSPEWSSDEKWLYFSFQESNLMTGSDVTKDKVYAMNLESQNIYESDRLAVNGNANPTWLPTSPSIVYTANTQKNASVSYPDFAKLGIYSYDILSQSGHFLLQSDGLNYSNPCISPDGKFILYAIESGFERELVLSKMGQDIGEYMVVNKPDESFLVPRWSYDSRYFLLHTSMTVGFNEVVFSDAIYDTTGAKYKEIKIEDWFIGEMTWSETGDAVYIFRHPTVETPLFTQLVKYDLKNNKLSDVLYVTTNSVYFLSQ